MAEDFFNSAYRRLNERIADLRSGLPVWWARPGFSTVGAFADNKPKKHVLLGRARDESLNEDGTAAAGRWDYIYTALCGYEYNRSEIIWGPIVPTKGTPKKDTRCLKCVKELDKLKATGQTVADLVNTCPNVSDDSEEPQ